jgi:hypothetical protein
MVTSALMILLQGQAMPWLSAKRVMANGERFTHMIYEFDPDLLRAAQLRMLQPYLDNPAFRPSEIREVSQPAANFCSWILGMTMMRLWRMGKGDERSDPLNAPPPSPPRRSVVDGPYPATEFLRHMKDQESGSERHKEVSFAEKLERKRQALSEQTQAQPPPAEVRVWCRIGQGLVSAMMQIIVFT